MGLVSLKPDRHGEAAKTIAHDLDVVFKRIAQMQADLDDMKRAWQKAKLLA